MHGNASLADIVAWLDAHLDVKHYAEAEPDSNGLLFDSGHPGVTKVAVALNTSLTTIVGAAKAGAQLLVVHHTTWAPIDLHLYAEKHEAMKTVGLSLYGAHAALDCLPRAGNAWMLASVLGVTVEDAFCEMYGGQAGVIGQRDGMFADFVQRASSELRVQVEAHQHARTFGRVAIVPGAGGMTSYMDEARRLGADTYITGEGSMYTRMFAKEAGMNLIFGTHYATETPGIRALGERIAGQAQIPFEFIEESQDVF